MKRTKVTPQLEDRVRAHLKEGATRQEAARKAGINPSTVYRILGGSSNKKTAKPKSRPAPRKGKASRHARPASFEKALAGQCRAQALALKRRARTLETIAEHLARV